MTNDDDETRANKSVVRRFNEEVITRGDEAAFHALMAPGFVNRTAPPGTSPGADGMWHMFHDVLRPALPDLSVEIHTQIGEGNLVTTRKTIHGTHRGPWFGLAPTGRRVAIDVIDIVRVENGQYAEHWGMNTLERVIGTLRGGG